MSLPKLGNKAPAFTLLNQRGEKVKLSDYKGKKVILFFYPKAMTPGCTTQACGMRDVNSKVESANAVTIAVSPDPVERLVKFTDKYDLNFTLLADEGHKICEKYGVWQLKKFMGKEFMGVVRTTFVIDEEGRISYISGKVKTKTHHEEMLEHI